MTADDDREVTTAAGIGCPDCGTILNAAAANCAGPWHADNQPKQPPTLTDEDATILAILVALCTLAGEAPVTVQDWADQEEDDRVKVRAAFAPVLAAAGARGYRTAIDALQDGERIAKWLGLKATGERSQRGAISYLRPAAEYLEAVEVSNVD